MNPCLSIVASIAIQKSTSARVKKLLAARA
jgi:hypothetical protein